MNRVPLKAFAAALAVAALAACSDAPVQPTVQDAAPSPVLARGQGTAEQVVPGDVIVRLRAGADLATVARAHGLAVKRLGAKNAFAVLAGTPGNERAIAARLGDDARVVYAEPNYIRQPTLDSRLWAFYNPGNLTVQWFNDPRGRTGVVQSLISKADADEDNVEGYAAGGAPVTIGSIDTGVDLDHQEFTGRLLIGTNWVQGGPTLPEDWNGHGTHTTGTMAGSTVGVAGVAGAAANVKVYVQAVCGRIGCFTSDIVSAIYEAADYIDPNGKHLVAVNISIGGTSLAQSEKDAIKYATDSSVLVVASAGNGGTGTVGCPACDVNAISVAATDWRDEHAYYTNWGSGLDISAPGGELFTNTTDEGGIWSAYLNNGYAYLQGTSMAAPQVTGTAAIVASVTGLRGAQLRARIESTTDDLGARGYDTDFGNGRLNSYRAVTGKSLAGKQ